MSPRRRRTPARWEPALLAAALTSAAITIGTGLAGCAQVHPAAQAVADAPAATSAAAVAAPVPYDESMVPRYRIRRATAPLSIDGRLDEFDWAAAPQIDAFTRILSDYGTVLHPTRARLLWDDRALYIAFACRDTDVWALYQKEDDPMWTEEVVEAFIDPDGDGRDYLELEVNPLNAVVDLHIAAVDPDWISDVDWDADGLETAVEVHGSVNDSSDVDRGWTVEIALPWSAFAPTIGGGGRPEIGDHWRLNLYRIERTAGAGLRVELRDAQARLRQVRARLAGLEASAADATARSRLEAEVAALQAHIEPLAQRYRDATEHTAWSPTLKRGFHHPQRFGLVEFAP